MAATDGRALSRQCTEPSRQCQIGKCPRRNRQGRRKIAMWKIETRNQPRSTLVKEQKHSPGCVRVYQGSPEDINLQLWCPTGRYTLVALFPAEARAIAEALIKAADKLLTPLEPETLTAIIAEGK